MSWNRIEEIILDVKPLFDAASDAICIQNVEGEIIYRNPYYEKMIKRGNRELVEDERYIYHNDRQAGKIVVYHDLSEINRLKRELDRLNQKLRKVQVKYSFKDIIGKNKELLKVVNTAKIAAMTPATIMIRGESGTGKEIFANAIHNNSPRRNEKFIKINCSSLPEELLESELFGYKEGAFTGARRGGKRGLFQEADRGTLFLDEIGDISSRMQVKLLRVLQEKEVMPVGSTETVPVDVRIICATNKPLEEMIEEGAFREDLYYRLNVFPLFIPPLRERREDIGLITEYLLNQYNEFYNRNISEIEPDGIDLLQQREWYGNVRELENVLSRALINMEEKDVVLTKAEIASALSGENVRNGKKTAQEKESNFTFPNNLKEALEMVESRCIEEAISRHKGDKNKAANDFGIPLRTLYYKCKKLNI